MIPKDEPSPRSGSGLIDGIRRGFAQLAQVAIAGAISGIIGITMAIVMIAVAGSIGGGAEPIAGPEDTL